MESLVNDLTSLTTSNAGLFLKKTTLNAKCQNHRKLIGLKKASRKNLRLCHNLKRKKLTLRRSSHLSRTNSNPHFTIKHNENPAFKNDVALFSNRKICSLSHNHKPKSMDTHQHQQSHHHHHHHHHRQTHKNRRHKSKNHRHRHNSSIRSSSLNKHKHIMTLLIAARASIEAKTKKNMKIAIEKGNVSSASSSTTCISNASSDSFKNLIRFKHTLKNRRKIGQSNFLESTETLCSSHHVANMIEYSNEIRVDSVSRFPKNKKKSLNLYKVQKTYRYRNYRLHCVRLRRLEKKSKKKQLMLRTRLQDNFAHCLNKTHGNRMTSVSTATFTSSSGTSSSSSTSSTENFDLEETSCNTDCLCSSEDFAEDSSHNRNFNKISENRSTTSSTSDSETSSSSVSGRSRSSSRSSQLSFSTTHSKENTTSDLEIDTSSLVESFNMANLNSGSEGSMKNSTNKQKVKDKNSKSSNKSRRRLLSRRQRRQLQQLKQTHGSEKNKKYNLMNLNISNSNKNSSTNIANNNSALKSKFCDLEQASSSMCCFKRKRLSSNHNVNNIEIEDSEKNYETKFSLLNCSSNLDGFIELNRKVGKPERSNYFEMDEKINSSEEIEYEKSLICSNDEELNNTATNSGSKNADEADDEHSDWNERVTSNLSTIFLEAQRKKSFEVTPWWDKNQNCFLNDEKSLNSSLDASLRKRSSYERLNLMESNIFNDDEDDDEEKDFKEMLTGALSLMNSESTYIYQSKVKDSIQKQHKSSNRKKRFNSFASDYNINCNIATKSTANLNSLLIEAQAVNNLPIPESNIGNKMLKNMGWSPGSSLGSKSEKNNLLTPIQTVKRPNRIGLGYDIFSDMK